MTSCRVRLASSPSQRLITIMAMPLPIRAVSARHARVHVSIPNRMASDCIGKSGTLR